MAKRWLKVEVTQEKRSDVYLLIDDEKTKLDTQPIRGTNKTRILINSELRKMAELAAADLDSLDWEEDEDISAGPVDEVSQADAEQYGVFDASEYPSTQTPGA